MHQYYIIYKPFNVLSQFTSQEGKQTLKDYFNVPRNVYPVGRLDYDSEGLLILTNDRKLTDALLNPLFAHEREYWIQVEGEIDQAAIQTLVQGVTITVDGKSYKTKTCKAEKFSVSPEVGERTPPIRARKNIPTSWIRLILTEGKNRQARKMTAKAGFPTLRLIRYRIEKVTIEGLCPGEMRMISREELTTGR
jgi:23S rRNA pseudouridine2457 synthase